MVSIILTKSSIEQLLLFWLSFSHDTYLALGLTAAAEIWLTCAIASRKNSWWQKTKLGKMMLDSWMHQRSLSFLWMIKFLTCHSSAIRVKNLQWNKKPWFICFITLCSAKLQTKDEPDHYLIKLSYLVIRWTVYARRRSRIHIIIRKSRKSNKPHRNWQTNLHDPARSAFFILNLLNAWAQHGYQTVHFFQIHFYLSESCTFCPTLSVFVLV